MNKIVIVNRWTGAVLWTGEADSQRQALEMAVAASADLGGANLGGANLRGANLGGANLRDANLGDANLRDANLRDANLRDANLRDANLRDANLVPIRDDVWAILSGAPSEVPTLLAKLRAGEVDGSCYEGDCACLVGTLANARGVNYTELCGVVPNASRLAETWFTGIHKGDTPETNPMAKHAETWIADWLARQQAAFGPKAVA